MASQFVPNPKGMAALANSPAVEKELVRRGTRVLNQARATAPVDTGRLRDSHTLRVERTKSRVRVRVYNTAPYAAKLATKTTWLTRSLDAGGGR